LAFRLTIPVRAAGSADEMARLQETIARRVRAVAGVTAAGMATALPMHPGGNINPLYAEGITGPGTPPLTRRHKWIGEGYFETLGIPLLAGRAFTWQDVHDRVAAVVVSESLARSYWGSIQAAIGKRVSVRPDPVRWYEVVGVAGDVREDGVGDDPVPMVYWPQVTAAFWQGTTSRDLLVWHSASYAVRSTRVGTPDFVREIRKAVWKVDPNLALVDVGRLSDFVKASRARTTFTLHLFGVAGVIALVLGLIGVYGVISYGVSQRTFELGIRIALGAEGGRVTKMVLRQGFVLASGGILVGLGLSLLVTRTMSALLFGVKANDPVTFVAVAAGVMAVTLVACYVPARRAARVDPLTALRTE
jgi:putative ABC transport system permease protein